MRVLLGMVAGICLVVAPVFAQTAAQPPLAQPCSGARECGISQQDFNAARAAFRRSQKLRGRDPEKALEALDEACRLAPRNPQYATAREMLKQQLGFEHVQRGNDLLAQRRTVEAAAEFRHALQLDPGNDFARQRLEAAAQTPFYPAPTFIEPSPAEEEISIRPQPGRRSFHFENDVRAAFTSVAAAYGIKVDFDGSVPGRRLRVDLNNLRCDDSLDTLASMTRTFWTPVSTGKIVVAADTRDKHKELDHWVLRTFYLPETSTPQELTDVVNLLRTLFEIRFVTPQPASATITVRGPAPVVRAATRLLESLWAGRPQVMLDIEAFEINRQMLQTIGLDLPLQFNVFNIPQAALAGLAGQNIQQLIAQLTAQGGLANNAAISALLAQLQNQQSSLFQQPVATFGGGTTLMGVGVPPASINFSRNESRVTTLEHVTMRAAQGNAASFRLGTRYPVLNASYAPSFSNPQIASALASQVFATPIPSFTYEDLGVGVKAKPLIHGASDVTLDLELEVKALTGQAFNGLPVISNRNYKGVITVKNDEPAIIAGSLSDSETATLSGLPGLGSVPGLGNRHKERDQSELLIIITPHIISAGPSGSAPAIVVPRAD